MAFTLATHVLLVPLGVAFPTLTLVMEGIGLARDDPAALSIARRWSVVMAVQFAVGAVTGTILSFEFGILWPRLMGRFGAALGLGFAIEGLAFFSRPSSSASTCTAGRGLRRKRISCSAWCFRRLVSSARLPCSPPTRS
ncbi:MAG: cytochrome ubiquinol oxidase subunit I [Chloroflexi bacterium]|nr:MAG: cytochrome ubiquinol oxidase subunit I [Chloroflexota bacterium]TMF87217.1 MAG: cytochrome ubiquinol oxidase subunit I [Chloroflexota bacterium]